MLIEASPFFETMFSLPQPKERSSHLLEPIPVSEPNRNLNMLLWLCYSVADKIPDGLPLGDVR